MGGTSGITGLLEKLAENKISGARQAKQIRNIIPIDQWLENAFYSGPDNVDIFPVWRNHIIEIFEGKYSELVLTGCFTGSTKIPLLDGTVKTLEELSILYPSEETPFWVYSYSDEGLIVPGRASYVRKTGEQKAVYRVMLDTGQSEYCTAAHLWMLRDGSYKKTNQLAPDDSLMPFYRAFSNQDGYHDPSPEGYERVYQPGLNHWVNTHRVVGYTHLGLPLIGVIGGKRLIHHKKARTNNCPEELQVVAISEHGRYHSELHKRLWKDPEYRERQKLSRGVFFESVRNGEAIFGPSEKCKASQLEFVHSKRGKEVSRQNLAIWNSNPSPEAYERRRVYGAMSPGFQFMLQDPEFREKHKEYSKIGNAALQEKCKKADEENINFILEANLHQLSLKTKIGDEQVIRALKRFDYPSTSKELRALGILKSEADYRAEFARRTREQWGARRLNHKIVSVEFSHYEDVYDLSVEKHHNFALKSGVFVHNSLGSGKSTIGDYCLIRKIYELSCFENIPRLFHMMDTTIISFLIFSITLPQAEHTGFGKIRRIMDSTPYFQRYFQRNKDKSTVLEFPSVHVMSGSGIGHQMGLDLCGSLMDEANFLGIDKTHIIEYDKATALYTAVANRRINRFVIGQEDLGMSIVVSSAADPTAFVESRIREADKEKRERGVSSIYVANVVSYEAKRKEYSEEEFCVFVGLDTIDPCIIDSNDDLRTVLHALKYDIEELDWRMDYTPLIKRHLPELLAIKFKFVPVDYRRLFEQNIHQAVQDNIGVSIGSDIKLFRNLDMYRIATEGMTTPWTKEEITLSNDDDQRLEEFFNFEFMKQLNMPHFIHVDQAVTRDVQGRIQNRAGLACAHVEKWTKVQGVTAPLMEVDWMLAISPPKRPDQIPLRKIKEFIFWLKSKGLNIGGATFDQFQSVANIQDLKHGGIEADTYSVDRDDKDWMSLTTLYYERRLKHPAHRIYQRELFGLEHDRNKHKVDHPAGGFKDVSDAVCGAVANAQLRSNIGVHMLQQFAATEPRKTLQAEIYNKIKKNQPLWD